MMPCSALQVPAAADKCAGLHKADSHPKGHHLEPQKAQEKAGADLAGAKPAVSKHQLIYEPTVQL